jgi:hypothetical protein
LRRPPSKPWALIALLLFASGAPAQTPTCRYQVVKPGTGTFTMATFSIDLGEADDPAKPQAWQGPIAIKQENGASCTVDPTVGIIELPIYQDGRHLLVTTYSGSNRVVYAIEAASCHVLWHSRPFTGPVHLKANKLQMGKQMATLGADCTPGPDKH